MATNTHTLYQAKISALPSPAGQPRLSQDELNKYLWEACKKGRLDNAKKWVAAGASVRATDENNQTALHHAAAGINEELIRFLIEDCQANVTAADKRGNTPFHEISDKPVSKNLLELYIRYGANIHQLNSFGYSVLHLCAGANNVEGMELFISLKIPVNLRHIENDEQTPLMTAATENHVAATRLLLSHKADITLTNSEGLTALSYAYINKAYDTAQILTDAGAQLSPLFTSIFKDTKKILITLEPQHLNQVMHTLAKELKTQCGYLALKELLTLKIDNLRMSYDATKPFFLLLDMECGFTGSNAAVMANLDSLTAYFERCMPHVTLVAFASPQTLKHMGVDVIRRFAGGHINWMPQLKTQLPTIQTISGKSLTNHDKPRCFTSYEHEQAAESFVFSPSMLVPHTAVYIRNLDPNGDLAKKITFALSRTIGDAKVYTVTGYFPWEIEAAKGKIVTSLASFNTASDYPPAYVAITEHSVDDVLLDEALINNNICKKTQKPAGVIVTTPLSTSSWEKLLFDTYPWHITLAPGITFPTWAKDLVGEPMPCLWQPFSSSTEPHSSYIKTPNALAKAAALKTENPYAIHVHITPDTTPNALSFSLTSTKNGFIETPSPFWTILSDPTKTVILTGLEQNRDLAAWLQTAMLPIPFVMMHGTDRPVQASLLILHESSLPKPAGAIAFEESTVYPSPFPAATVPKTANTLEERAQLQVDLIKEGQTFIVLEGDPGSGKTHSLKPVVQALTSQLNQPCHVYDVTVGPGTVMSDILPLLQPWASSTAFGKHILRVEEANLLPPGSLDFFYGLAENPSHIRLNGIDYPLTPDHIVLITQNSSSEVGRHSHSVLNHLGTTIYYPPMTDAEFITHVIHPICKDYIPDSFQDDFTKALMTIRDYFGGDSISARDIENWTLHAAYHLETGISIKESVLYGVMDEVAGQLSPEELKKFSQYCTDNGLGTPLLRPIHPSFSYYIDHFFSTSNTIVDTSSTRAFVTQMANALYVHAKGNEKGETRGKVCLMVEGFPGTGKDDIPRQFFKYLQTYAPQLIPGGKIIEKVCGLQKNEVEEAIQAAGKTPQLLHLSETGLLPKGTLEKFNKLFGGKMSTAGPRSFFVCTRNPAEQGLGASRGRQPDSEAFTSRATKVYRPNYSSGELRDILEKKYNTPSSDYATYLGGLNLLSLHAAIVENQTKQGNPLVPSPAELFKGLNMRENFNPMIAVRVYSPYPTPLHIHELEPYPRASDLTPPPPPPPPQSSHIQSMLTPQSGIFSSSDDRIIGKVSHNIPELADSFFIPSHDLKKLNRLPLNSPTVFNVSDKTLPFQSITLTKFIKNEEKTHFLLPLPPGFRPFHLATLNTNTTIPIECDHYHRFCIPIVDNLSSLTYYFAKTTAFSEHVRSRMGSIKPVLSSSKLAEDLLNEEASFPIFFTLRETMQTSRTEISTETMIELARALLNDFNNLIYSNSRAEEYKRAYEANYEEVARLFLRVKEGQCMESAIAFNLLARNLLGLNMVIVGTSISREKTFIINSGHAYNILFKNDGSFEVFDQTPLRKKTPAITAPQTGPSSMEVASAASKPADKPTKRLGHIQTSVVKLREDLGQIPNPKPLHAETPEEVIDFCKKEKLLFQLPSFGDQRSNTGTHVDFEALRNGERQNIYIQKKSITMDYAGKTLYIFGGHTLSKTAISSLEQLKHLGFEIRRVKKEAGTFITEPWSKDLLPCDPLSLQDEARFYTKACGETDWVLSLDMLSSLKFRRGIGLKDTTLPTVYDRMPRFFVPKKIEVPQPRLV
jgi:ankyrin repeat protein